MRGPIFFLSQFLSLVVLIYPCAISAQFDFFHKRISADFPLTGYSILKDSNDAFVLVGNSNGTGTNSDIIVIKTNYDGEIIWAKSYSGGQRDFARGVIETADGNYMLVGSTFSPPASDKDIFLLKLTSGGNVIWSKVYGTNEYDRGFSVKNANDGGYIIGGTYNLSSSTSDRDAALIKVDENGNVQWSKFFGGGKQDNCFNVLPASDGGYFFTGPSTSFNNNLQDYSIYKISATGDFVWGKLYGSGLQEHSRIIKITPDGGLVIVGHTNNWGAGGWETFLVKLDINGVLQWSRTYGSSGDDFLGNIIVKGNGNFLIVGHTTSFGVVGEKDVFIIEVSPNGDLLNSFRWDIGGDDYLPFGAEQSIVLDSYGNLDLLGTVGADFLFSKMPNNLEQDCLLDEITFLTSSVPANNQNINSPEQTHAVNPALNINFIVQDIDVDILDICASPVAKFQAPDTICMGECIDVIDSSYANITSWNWWIEGAGVPFMSGLAIGEICYDNYGEFSLLLAVENEFGVDTFQKEIVVLPIPSFTLGNDTTICDGDQIVLFPMNEFITNGATYTWEDGSHISERQVGMGSYSLMATYWGCEFTDEISVEYSECIAPTADFSMPDSICQYECISIEDLSSGSPQIWRWMLDGVETNNYSIQNIPEICFDSIGRFDIKLQVANDFGMDSVVRTIMVFPSPEFYLGRDTTICEKDELTLIPEFLTFNGGSLNYEWNDGLESPVRKVSEGLFTLTIKNEYCFSMDSILVESINCEPCNFFIPNVFSPNDDGINDLFFPYFYCQLTRYKISIFDRWGEKVFCSEELEDTWDGTFRGHKMHEGVYTYVIEVEYIEIGVKKAKVIGGDVVLIR